MATNRTTQPPLPSTQQGRKPVGFAPCGRTTFFRRARKPMLTLRTVPLLALAGLLGAASGAAALGIDEVNEVYFEGPAGFGFDSQAVADAGLSISFGASPDDDWLSAGHVSFGLPIEITQVLGTVYQDPQAGGGVPDPDDPFIGDSSWTVRNASGRTLIAPLLVFTSVDPGGTYPEVQTGLDGNLLRILEYSFDGVDYLFGVVVLSDLEDGESVDIDVRYVVADPLVQGVSGASGTSTTTATMPPLGVSVAASYSLVPEPGTWLLVACSGASLVFVARRRSRWSRS
jgi:hypothetical protein